MLEMVVGRLDRLVAGIYGDHRRHARSAVHSRGIEHARRAHRVAHEADTVRVHRDAEQLRRDAEKVVLRWVCCRGRWSLESYDGLRLPNIWWSLQYCSGTVGFKGPCARSPRG